jgi:hypothetical protein
MVRQNGQRRQCNCAYISMRRLYRHSTEQNVTHDEALRVRYERKQNVFARSQVVNQVSLIGTPESGFVNSPDLLPVASSLVPDECSHHKL